MKFIADFHIHSKYSRATSRSMDISSLALWAGHKGIDLLGTGDFTHPLWIKEIKKHCQPLEDKGLLISEGIHFILSAEVSNIFSQNGKGYRVHNVIMAPSLKVAEEINVLLSGYGKLFSDGRPILGMSCRQLAQELFAISPDIMLVPAHVWTPWFGVFGSKSGFNSLEEAYGPFFEQITALETGLSSDPSMNWRCSQLDRFSLISNSDAHSPRKIGREANVFDCELDYWEIKEVLEKKNSEKFLYTIEFFPQEGKYHYDGHRECNIRFHPRETKKHKGICPVCGRPLTKGVLYRVDELADHKEGTVPDRAAGYKSLIPLEEIIAETKGVGPTAKSVANEYTALISEFGSELELLVNVSEKDLEAHCSKRIAEGIKRVRQGKVVILPGYDGEYGSVKIFSEEERKEFGARDQLRLF